MKFIVNGANDVSEVLGYILCEMLAKCPDSSIYSLPPSGSIDFVIYAFYSSVQKSKSLGLEFM